MHHATSPCHGTYEPFALWEVTCPNKLPFQLISFQEVTMTYHTGNHTVQLDCPLCFASNSSNSLFCPLRHTRHNVARQPNIHTTPLESHWRALEILEIQEKTESEFISFLERLSPPPLSPWTMSHLETSSISSYGKTRIQKHRYTRNPALTKAPTPSTLLHASALDVWRSKPSTLISVNLELSCAIT